MIKFYQIQSTNFGNWCVYYNHLRCKKYIILFKLFVKIFYLLSLFIAWLTFLFQSVSIFSYIFFKYCIIIYLLKFVLIESVSKFSSLVKGSFITIQKKNDL